MGRKVAIPWHVLFSIAAGVLYFFCVLPRWSELMGDTPHSVGTAVRIVSGALIGLAALPVVFTLLRTRKPELGDPAAGAVHTGLVDRGPRAGRPADHRHRDQRDLAQPGRRRTVVVRHLRRRRRDRGARVLRVLSVVYRRVAAAAAETDQAEEARSGDVCAARRATRRTPKKPKEPKPKRPKRPKPKRPRPDSRRGRGRRIRGRRNRRDRRAEKPNRQKSPSRPAPKPRRKPNPPPRHSALPTKTPRHRSLRRAPGWLAKPPPDGQGVTSDATQAHPRRCRARRITQLSRRRRPSR